jgi:hypothetical protein
LNKECVLCKNNPNKRCCEDDNFDECYADNQVLRARCDADIHIELVNGLTGAPQHVPGLELQVCAGGTRVVDASLAKQSWSPCNQEWDGAAGSAIVARF